MTLVGRWRIETMDLWDRDGPPRVEFSWQGDDEGDEVCGRGWAALSDDGPLDGHLILPPRRRFRIPRRSVRP
jgi:hypothetical protein